jgi:tetratricopeptide (TPR) repeat protein
VSPRKKKKAAEYERPEHGPGSEDQHRSLNHTLAVGLAAWEQDNFAEALELYEAVLKDHPHFADVRNKAGLCLAMMGDVEGALDYFDRALEINERYAEAHLNRAVILNDLGRYDEAAEAFSRATTLDVEASGDFPSDVGNQLANAHAVTGDLYLGTDHPEEAAREYAAAVTLRPRFLDLRFKLVEAYMDLGRLGDARDHVAAILDLNPDFLKARIRLGAFLQRIGDDAGAHSEWERCAEQDPEDRRIQAYLASLDS